MGWDGKRHNHVAGVRLRPDSRRALGGGGGGTQTVVQQEAKNRPWYPQGLALTDIYKNAYGAYNKTSKDPYGGSYYAGPTDLQQQAIQGATNYAQGQIGLGQNVIDMANRTIAGDYLSPESNPSLQGAIDAATRPVYENLTRTVLPGIASAAIGQGAYGGTREGITQALAGAEAGKTAGDIAAGMAYNNYDAERSRQFLAPGLLQQGYQTGLMPYDTLGQAGTTQQGWNQAQLDELLQKWNAQQQAPWAGLQDYKAAVEGGNFSNSTQTQTSTGAGGASSVLQGALGGAGLGAMLGNSSLFGGLTGAALGPWALGGAAVGGLLGLF